MRNQTDLPIMRWRIRCVQNGCDWQARIAALEPFTHRQQPVDVHHFDQVVGFWEDYVCPTHFETERRAVVVSIDGVGLEYAQFLYVTGLFETTPVPSCPVCQCPMQGGPSLAEALPFSYQSILAMLKWLLGELGRIKHRIDAELYTKDGAGDVALRDIRQDLWGLRSFYDRMCQNFDINPTVVPLLEITDQTLINWQAVLAENIAILEKSEQQLRHRQAQEAHKTPATCPACQQQSVYLIEATTV